jgi:hypothetical protein
MRFALPDELALLRTVVLDVAAKVGGDKSDDQFRALDDVGIFDLHADATGLGNLASVVALEAVAQAGTTRGPWAETMLSRRLLRDAAGLTAVTVPVGQASSGLNFIPFGRDFPTVLRVAADGVASLVTLDESLPADVPNAKDGHAWAVLDGPVVPLGQIDAAFAWRAQSATSLGYATALLLRAAEHARVRTQFGKPIASFQSIESRLAESLWRTEGLRLIVREAAWRADQNDARATAVSAMAWLYAREVSRRVARHAHQIFGAVGFTDELNCVYVAGAAALLRTSLPAQPAVEAILAARSVATEPASVPPSTILGGFRDS